MYDWSGPPDASTRGVHLTVHCLLNCILQNVKMTLCSTDLDHQMPLLGVCLTVHCLLNCILQNVMMTLCSTDLDHQMPLPGGYIWLSTAFLIAFCRMSRWLYIILFWTTRCLYWGVYLTVHCLLNCILQNVKMTLRSTGLDHQMPLLGGSSAFLNSFRFHALLHRGLFYERPTCLYQSRSPCHMVTKYIYLS